MNKTQKIIAITLGILALASVAAAITAIILTRKPAEPPVPEEPVLDCPMEDGTVTYGGQTGQTALDILASICEIETTTSEDGQLTTVTAIDGITATTPDWWALYINDTPALLGPAALQTTETDTIKWRLESLGN